MADSNAITVTLQGDASQLDASCKTAEKQLDRFEKATQTVTGSVRKQWQSTAFSVAALGVAFQTVSTAIRTYIIAPISDAVNSFVQFGDQLAKTSQRVGISAESLGGLKFAAEQCGATIFQ